MKSRHSLIMTVPPAPYLLESTFRAKTVVRKYANREHWRIRKSERRPRKAQKQGQELKAYLAGYTKEPCESVLCPRPLHDS